MGECPDFYALIQHAKYLRVAPWELQEQSLFWRYAAATCLEGEHQARKTLDARRK